MTSRRNSRRNSLVLAAATLAVLITAACGSSGAAKSGDSAGPTSDMSGGTPLVGTFALSAGTCSSAGASGTYFRMIDPGGSIAKGKFFTNPDSTCADKSYTPAGPGTAGGFVTGRYQPNPTPAFDAHGDALATGIVTPASFTAIKFTISTNKTDPQTHKVVPAPAIENNNGVLSGQLTAWSAAWNNQYFNQGSPQPDGSSPGLTSPVTGTYDAATGAFVLTWASEVVTGPFNGFTGYWHLSGKFTPKK
jgi:hypothetical protein